MIPDIRCEILKLRTVWSTWVIMLIATAASALLGLVVGFAPRRRAVESFAFPVRGTVRWFDLVLSTMTICVDLALVLGVIAITGEYRHKTVTSTFLSEPRRGKVVGAKLFTGAWGGALVAVAGGAGALVLGFGLVAGGFGNTSRMLTEFRHVFPGVLAASFLFAVYGLGLGALLKNQVVALVVGLGASAVVEPIIVAVDPSVGRWLPDQAASALESVTARARGGGFFTTPGTHLVTWWEGALVLVAYGVVLSVAGAFTTLRADVT